MREEYESEIAVQIKKIGGKKMKKTIIVFGFMLIAVCAFAQNYSLNFDGVDDYVNFGNIDFISTGVQNECSVSFWLNMHNYNTTLTGDQAMIFGDEISQNNGILIQIHSTYGYGAYIAGSTNWAGYSNYLPPLNQWVYFTQIQNANGIDLYIDGSFYQNLTSQTNSETSANTRVGLHTGSTGAASRPFYGKMDQLSVWNKALTQQEIQDNMYNELTGNENGLAGYWNFNEGVGSILNDQTSNGNDGTINGATWQTSGVPMPTDLKIIRNGTLSQTSGFLTISASSISSPHFVAFGHNNEDLSSIVSFSVTGYNQRLSRVWFVDNYGVTTPTLTFVLETTPSSSSISDYGLIKSSSSDMSSASEVMTATSVNIGTKTITFELSAKASLDDGYYTIGSKGSATLPVELSYFNAQFIGSSPILCWTTQSESGNAGWNVYRGDYRDAFINGDAIQINLELIEGAGTTSIPTDYTFEDQNNIIAGNEYWYILESVDYSGETQIHGSVSLTIPEEGTTQELPQQTVPLGNHPNPFNPNTTISFTVKENETAHLSIFNVKGQKLESISFEAGIYNYLWDASSYASGIYLYKLKSLSFSEIRKMILLK